MSVADAEPYAHPLDHLRDHLRLILLLLTRHVGRYGFRMMDSAGNLNDTFVSFREAGALLHGEQPLGYGQGDGIEGWPAPADVARSIAEHKDWMAARLEATMMQPSPPELPIEELRARFGLDEVELTLVMAAVAPQLSVDVSRLYAFARGDFTDRAATVGFLVELTGLEPGAWARRVGSFEGGGALIRQSLLRLRTPTARPHASLLHREVVASDALTAFVRGDAPQLPLHLAPACQWWEASDDFDALILPDGLARQLRRLMRRLNAAGQERPWPLMLGSPGVGRRSSVGSLWSQLGLSVLTVDLGVLSGLTGDLPEALADLFELAVLRRAGVVLRGDAALDDSGWVGEHGLKLGQALHVSPAPVVITAWECDGTLKRTLPRLEILRWPLPSRADQERAWRDQLEAAGWDEADLDAAAESLSNRYATTPGRVSAALADAGPRRQLDRSSIDAAMRRLLQHQLSDLAEIYTTPLSWEDMIFDDETLEVLEEVLIHARHHHEVFEQWGLARRVAYGRGLSCLFSGPPGTGKTMVAGILARTLERELYRVDISRLVSKWVGETEKNLARLFREAEAAQAILLFDEADALFSKRTEVRGANDRFANMEINYLLQRMEHYEGITILTTNLEKGIDAAFKRRFRFVVPFAIPEADIREEIWRTSMPPEAALEEGLSYRKLAAGFEIAGGNIKNAIIRAAFRAAAADKVITYDMLAASAAAEARAMGMLVRLGGEKEDKRDVSYRRA